jgi:hypothetical protein
MAAQNSHSDGGKPAREVDPLTTRILASLGEEMGTHLTSGHPLTGEEMLKSAITIAASAFALSDVQRESLQGVLRGTSTRLIDMWKKRKDKKDFSAAQAGEWATKIMVDDYAKSLDDGEKNPNFLAALGMLAIGEHITLTTFMTSRHLLDPKDMAGIAAGSPEEAKKIEEARKKVIKDGDKIMTPLRQLRGALLTNDETMRYELLRKLIRVPEESGPMELIKKLTGIDLAHLKPEKILDEGKEFVAKMHVTNARTQSSLDLHHRVNLEERLQRQQVQAAQRGFWSKVRNWLF